MYNLNENKFLPQIKHIGLIIGDGTDSIYSVKLIEMFNLKNINVSVFYKKGLIQVIEKSYYSKFENVVGVFELKYIPKGKYDFIIGIGFKKNEVDFKASVNKYILEDKIIDIPKIFVEEGIQAQFDLELIGDLLFAKKSPVIVDTEFSYENLIIGIIRYFWGKLHGDLIEKKIIITSGGTREFIDPVRVITNRSSGKMGKAFAETLLERGADIKYICTKESVFPPVGVKTEYFSNTKSLRDRVFNSIENYDAIIMVAAVSDFTVENSSKQKIKKDGTDKFLKLKQVDNFIKDLPRKLIKIGFAAETNADVDIAKMKLKNRGFDYICLNEVSLNKGFEVDVNKITLIDANNVIHITDENNKLFIAREIVNCLSKVIV